MINNAEDKVNNFMFSKIGIYLLLISFIFAVFAIIFDPGPLVPPFSQNFSSIDCSSVEFESLEQNNSILWFKYHVDEPIEYIAPYFRFFLKVHAKSNTKDFIFNGKNLKNISKNGDKIKYFIDIPSYDDYNVSFSCLNKNLGTKQISIKNITINDNNMSSSPNPKGNIMVLNNVCVRKNQIFYFSEIDGTIDSINVSDDNFQFSFFPLAMNYCADANNLTIVDETTFFIDKVETNWWSSILFTLNPIASSIDAFASKNGYNFIYSNQPSKVTTDLLRRFHPKNSSFVDKGGCYKRFIFTNTKSDHNLSSDSLIRESLHKNFTTLRNSYVTRKREPRMIILPSCVSHLQDDVKEVCPDCNIFSLTPRLDMNNVVDHVSRGTILIGNHLNNLIHAIWLEPNATAVVDVSPPEHEVCIDYAKDFVEGLNISYFGVLNDFYANKTRESCRCKNFSCMKPAPTIHGEIDRKRFKEALRAAINATMSV